MPTHPIPVYDIEAIAHRDRQDLLIDRFGGYLNQHYHRLHHPHRHSFYHLVMFTKGSGTHTIDFDRFPVEPFQMYFMVPGQVHSWHFNGDVDGYIVHFNAQLFHTFLQDANYLDRFTFFRGSSKESVRQIPHPDDEKIQSIFENLIRHKQMQALLMVDYVRVKLLELFMIVEQSTPPATSGSTVDPGFALVQRFRQLIEQHYQTTHSPAEYAKMLFVTPNHLNTVCRAMLNKSSGDLIQDRIALEAKRLLTNVDMSVAEIAYQLNFTDNAYFTRFFKRVTGTTPEMFRKAFKE
jgi:AraC family transcriptional activator of pobA